MSFEENAMPAIVLSVDKYHQFLSHMLLTYSNKWPDNELQFRVPWNDVKPVHLEENYGNRVQLIQTPSEFKKTIEALTQGIDDDDWVYWTQDDIYIANIDPEIASKTLEFIRTIDDPEIVGVTFSNLNSHKEQRRSDFIESDNLRYVRILSPNQWMPQFWRAKVLKALFDSIEEPKAQDPKKNAKKMDHMINYEEYVNGGVSGTGRGWINWSKQFKFYMLDKKIASWGESTSRGVITRNCVESFDRHNLEIPSEFLPANKRIIYT